MLLQSLLQQLSFHIHVWCPPGVLMSFVFFRNCLNLIPTTTSGVARPATTSSSMKNIIATAGTNSLLEQGSAVTGARLEAEDVASVCTHVQV